METVTFDLRGWVNRRYAGNGTYYNNTHYVCTAYRIQNEIGTITFNGTWKVKVFKRNSTSESWTETITTDQIHTSAWLTNLDYTARVMNPVSISDGSTFDIGANYDALRLIINVYFINSSLFELHPMGWEPDSSSTGEFYALYEAPSVTYTYFAWYMGGEFPTNENLRDEAEYTEPIPLSQWTIKEGYNEGFPFNGLLRDIPFSKGAFEDAASLASVRVPITVKTIGPTAFAGTALKRVKIAADCTYEETSFPDGCVVTRYPDDRYEQLYDCDGKAVLDYDGARVYVLKEDNNNG